jgi:hypothetical protein
MDGRLSLQIARKNRQAGLELFLNHLTTAKEEGFFQIVRKIPEGGEVLEKEVGLNRKRKNRFFEDKRKVADSNRNQPDIVQQDFASTLTSSPWNPGTLIGSP